MQALSVCLFVTMCSVSAVFFRESGFYYAKSMSIFRRATEAYCMLCFSDDCTSINEARCEYHMAAAELMNIHTGNSILKENKDLRTAVDTMMFNMMEKAAATEFPDCIPFISMYTDCFKENLCLGCNTCTCDEEGRWKCTISQQCRVEENLNVNHKALVMAIDSLENDNYSGYRAKRSTRNTEVDQRNKMSYEEISEWMYDVKPISENNSVNEATTNEIKRDSTTESLKKNIGVTVNDDKIQNTTGSNVRVGAEYLEFDEVLNNIAVDNDMHTQMHPKSEEIQIKPSIDTDDLSFNIDNMTIDDLNATNFLVDIVNGYEVTELTPSVTKVVIDILEAEKSRVDGQYKSPNKTNNDDYVKINNADKNELDPVFEDTNYLEAFKVLDINKRDVLQLNETITATESTNTKDPVQEIRDNVLYPLNNIVSEKQNELKELLRVRDGLIDFIKTLNNNVSIETTYNKTENNRTYFSMLKLEIVPEYDFLDYEFRKNDINILDKYSKKIQQDIYEVLKDIVSIQKYSNSRNLPNNLKILIRAMKYYIRNQNETNFTNYNKSMSHANNMRRNWKQELSKSKLIKDFLMEILKTIDKDLPQVNALGPLSNKSKSLVYRVVKENYFDEYAVVGLKVSDPNYNLINDLEDIGTRWQEMTIRIENCSPYDRLYNMKLLHLILSLDITKMSDALSLVDFAHSRRRFIDSDAGEKILLKLNDNIKLLNHKIRKVIESRKNTKQTGEVIEINSKTKSKKNSFLKQIRNLLRSSKKNIVGLMHKKVPKSQIVKELAKKKLDELSRKKMVEYEETLQRWQNNLNVRSKRSPFDFAKLKQRLTKILPTYLRGKVNPAIKARGKNNKNDKHRSHHKGNKSQGTTTPKPAVTNNLNKLIF